MVEIAEKIIDILGQALEGVVNIEVDPPSVRAHAIRTTTSQPPLITVFGTAIELAEMLAAFSTWRGPFEVSGMRSEDGYEFWIN